MGMVSSGASSGDKVSNVETPHSLAAGMTLSRYIHTDETLGLT